MDGWNGVCIYMWGVSRGVCVGGGVLCSMCVGVGVFGCVSRHMDE